MGLVSGARDAVNAALDAELFEVVDVFDVVFDVMVDDPAWTAHDDAEYWRCVVEGSSFRPADHAQGLREAVSALRSLEEQRSRLVAEQQRLMLALAGSEPRSREVTVSDEDDGPRVLALTDEAVEVIAVALRRSPVTVSRQLANARMLLRMPGVLAAMERGGVGADHADQVARVAHDLPEAQLPRYERAVLSRLLRPGSAMTPGEVGALCRRLRARIDSAGEEARRVAARRHEDVRIWAEDDGLACLQARIPIADAARVHAALDARARLQPYHPDDSIGMRRAAALVQAVCGGYVSGASVCGASVSGAYMSGDGATAGAGVALQVTVDLATLMGLDDAPAHVTMPSGTPEPVTAEALRELLSDPHIPVTLRRLITEPIRGDVLDRGRTSYRVPDDLRDFLVSRDGTCRFPGCPRRAERCDIDHIVPWDAGGTTDRANLMPLCRRHHLLKTFGEWSDVERRDDGTVVWRAPDGRPVVTHPWRPSIGHLEALSPPAVSARVVPVARTTPSPGAAPAAPIAEACPF